jgi:hypothetical protein
MRGRLEAASAVAAVVYIALKAEAADADFDVTVAIQRCVLHELREKIKRVDSVIPMLNARSEASGRRSA